VSGNARVGPAEGDDQFHLSLAGDVIIDAGSLITADGRGFGPGNGPGAGVSGADEPGGGGYGGHGARGRDYSGGSCYGSVTAPEDLGSGGGVSSAGYGFGGGIVRLSVLGTLRVDGGISANGAYGGGSAGGGGSGGSVLLTCGTLTGTGQVSANGGPADFNRGGGGGGGSPRTTTQAISILASSQRLARVAISGLQVALCI
jgi:hypothetical protein